MSIIYEPTGKGNEESGLCANLYRRCGHGCTYCYSPSATYTKREIFFKYPEPRKDCIQEFKKDVAKLIKKSDINRLILFSLSCDTYQPIDVEYGLTREALKILTFYGIPVRILTKGGLRAERDLDLLKKDPRNEFGCTMTNDEEKASLLWEPGAAVPEERMEILRKAKKEGIYTWVSMEPVVDPEAVYRLLEKMKGYVDIFKIGKLNYHPRAKVINWRKFRTKVVERCQKLGVNYFIKIDLANIPPAITDVGQLRSE